MRPENPHIRLRVAPSPTGFLHLGTLRTALFGYLLAKHWGGSFILRIEDTDQKREVAGAVESLINVFNRVGISFDESPEKNGDYGPYVQSERLSIYKKYADELVEKGEAYYCFATPEELEALRQELTAQKVAPRYDRRFRDYPIDEAKKRIEAGEAYVIRHKMPLDGTITVKDELRGEISFNAADLDDYVLLKSDGFPTYHLCSVIDDHEMKISHVTRGEEWIPSLPKNILLYKSFAWDAPKFIHLPLILNKTGGKLSKRQGDVFVEQYFDQGYLKEALINFCALLGWHPKDEKEFFTLEELVEVFDIDGIGISPAMFDQEKLDFINSHYIKQTPTQLLLELARPHIADLIAQANESKSSDAFIMKILALEQPRIKVLSELKDSTAFFFKDQLEFEAEMLIWKKCDAKETLANLDTLKNKLLSFKDEEWTEEMLETTIVSWLKSLEIPLGNYLWPMRVALSGQKASPGPFEIAAILGKVESLAKIERATILLSKNVL